MQFLLVLLTLLIMMQLIQGHSSYGGAHQWITTALLDTMKL